MSSPFVYVGTYRIREGQLDAFKQMCAGITQMVEAKEPRLIAINFYVSDDGREVSCVQVHPDADSMVNHMEILSEHLAAAGGGESPIEEVTVNHVYGTPNDRVIEMIEEWDPGVPLIVKPDPLAGFTRSAAQAG